MRIKLLKKISPVSLTLILISLILLVSAYNFRWKDEQWKYAVHTDALHYYRYLPMIFIEKQFDPQAIDPDFVKGFAGTPVLYSPFFAIACLISYLVGLPVDGYSMLFPIFVSIGTIFFLVFGLYFFSKFLKFYISRQWVICVVILAMAFATIEYHYTINTPGWAHMPAFALVCFLLFHFKKMTVVFNALSITVIIAGLSFLFFIRPTDTIIILVAPFLAANPKEFLEIFKKVFSERKAIIIGALLAAIPLICQLAIYKIYTGQFIVWSYGSKEGFDFLHPEIFKVLFSYAKGFFVYTPICFLALFGFFRLYKMNKYLFTGVMIYMVLNIYVISSWWSWNYGFCFGARAFIEHHPLFFFLLALLLDIKNGLIKITTVVVIAFFSFLNLFQTHQVTLGILDLDFKTDAKGYWNVFLSTTKGFSGKYYRFPVDESPENIVSRISMFNDMENYNSAWINLHTRVTGLSHSGNYSSYADSTNMYSVGLKKKLNEIPYNRNVLIRVSAWFYIPDKKTQSYFAFSFVSEEKGVVFRPFGLRDYIQNYNQWEYHFFEMQMPKLSEKAVLNPTTQIRFYLFNDSKVRCYIDDLTIEFIEFKKMDRVLDPSWD
jgi:hypothetical protein